MAATLLASGATMEQAAEKIGAQSPKSLRVGLIRRGVTMRSIRTSEGNLQRITGVANKVLNHESERLKKDFADLLSQHTGALKDVKPSKNLKKAKQFAEVLEPLARTAKIVHNWGESGPNGVVLVGEMDGTDRAPIDIPSTDVKLVSTGVEEAPPPREFDL